MAGGVSKRSSVVTVPALTAPIHYSTMLKTSKVNYDRNYIRIRMGRGRS